VRDRSCHLSDNFFPHHDVIPSCTRSRKSSPEFRARLTHSIPCYIQCRPTLGNRGLQEGTDSSLHFIQASRSILFKLKEMDVWDQEIRPGGKYYFTRQVSLSCRVSDASLMLSQGINRPSWPLLFLKVGNKVPD